jgi:hypothetical protein
VNTKELLGFMLVLSLAVPSASAQGLGLVQPETTYETSSAWLNTSIKVFDPSSRPSQISLRSTSATSYNVSALSLDTASMSPESRYYVAGSYVPVYSLPVHIRIDRQKTQYDVELEVESRPTDSVDGPIPVVTRPLELDLQYNGPLQSQDVPRTDLEFEPQRNRTADRTSTETSNATNQDGSETSKRPGGNASTGAETRTGSSPNPVLLLFIAATACYILWKI